MSFQNYDNFPSQQGGQEGGAGPGAQPQQDPNMGGQIPGSAGGQYEGGNGGQPGSAGGQSDGGDAKTTLWYVAPRTVCFMHVAGSYCATLMICSALRISPRAKWQV